MDSASRHRDRADLDKAQILGTGEITATARDNMTGLEWEPSPNIMRCYFNLVNGTEKILDHDGIEVRDLEQAQLQAMKAVEELREEDDGSDSEWDSWHLEVTDASGNILFLINLGKILH